MYEYIQNSIIEGSLKYLIQTATTTKTYMLDNWDNFFPPFWAFVNVIGVPTICASYYNITGNDIPEYIKFMLGLIGIGVPLYQIHLIMKQNAEIDAMIIKLNEEHKDEPPPLIPANVPYEHKYVNMWNKRVEEHPELLSNTSPENLVNLKHNVLFETTPVGNVIMYYDHTKSSFVYYCDKTLPYGIINSVGRHYALKFNCEGLFLDENTPPPKSSMNDENKNEKEENKKTTTTIKQNPNVYAKFKTYKSKSSTSSETNKETSKTETKPSSTVIEVNRYTCEGKLSNFDFLQRVPKIRKLSYKDFKELYKKKTEVKEVKEVKEEIRQDVLPQLVSCSNTEGSSPTEFIVV